MSNLFNLRLLCKHPSMTGDWISQKTNTIPTWVKNIGETRKTPKGTVLNGIYTETIFCKIYKFENERNFFKQTYQTFKYLENHAENVMEITNSGGVVTLCIDLINNQNIGDVASLELLNFLNKLKIEFRALL